MTASIMTSSGYATSLSPSFSGLSASEPWPAEDGQNYLSAGANVTSEPALYYSAARVAPTVAVLVLMILATVVGNVFVVAAIAVERNLRTVANYLIASLAVADLLVAALVMPLAAVNEVTRRWTLGSDVCEAWIALDVLCCTSSILHLVAISLDRYWAVTRLDYIMNRSARRILLMVGMSWGVSALISLPPLLGHRDPSVSPDRTGQCLITQDWIYTMFSTICAFYLPLIAMMIIYTKVYSVAKSRIRKRHLRRVTGLIRSTMMLPGSHGNQAEGASLIQSPGVLSPLLLTHSSPNRLKAAFSLQPQCGPLVCNSKPGLDVSNVNAVSKKATGSSLQVHFDLSEPNRTPLPSKLIDSTRTNHALCSKVQSSEEKRGVPESSRNNKILAEGFLREDSFKKNQEKTPSICRSQTFSVQPITTLQPLTIKFVASPSENDVIRPNNISKTVEAVSVLGQNATHTFIMSPTFDEVVALNYNLASVKSTKRRDQIICTKKNTSPKTENLYQLQTNALQPICSSSRQPIANKPTWSDLFWADEEIEISPNVRHQSLMLDRCPLEKIPLLQTSVTFNTFDHASFVNRQEPTLVVSAENDGMPTHDQTSAVTKQEWEHLEMSYFAMSSNREALSKLCSDESSEKGLQSVSEGVRHSLVQMKMKKSSERDKDFLREFNQDVDNEKNKGNGMDMSDDAEKFNLTNIAKYEDDRIEMGMKLNEKTQKGEQEEEKKGERRNGSRLAYQRFCDSASPAFNHALRSITAQRIATYDHATGHVSDHLTNQATGLVTHQLTNQATEHLMTSQLFFAHRKSWWQWLKQIGGESRRRNSLNHQSSVDSCCSQNATFSSSSPNSSPQEGLMQKTSNLGAPQSGLAPPGGTNGVPVTPETAESYFSGTSPKLATSSLGFTGPNIPAMVPPVCVSQPNITTGMTHGKSTNITFSTGAVTVKLVEPSSNTDNGSSLHADSSAESAAYEQRKLDARAKHLEQRRERKAARTLAIVTGTFVFCWLPFFILALVMPFCGQFCRYPRLLVSVAGWLGYANSLLNPVIYTIFNPDFRLAFRKVIYGRKGGGRGGRGGRWRGGGSSSDGSSRRGMQFSMSSR